MSTTTLTSEAVRAELVKALEADLIGPFVPAGHPGSGGEVLSVEVHVKRYGRAANAGADPRQVAAIGETLGSAQASSNRRRKARA